MDAPLAVAFDVNETLLDMSALDPLFERLFGDASIRREWFAAMLQSALVSTVVRRYEPFGRIGAAALAGLAEARGVALEAGDTDALGEGMTSLPAHPDARGGLDALRRAGVPVAALTNSTVEVASAQLEHAGLRDLVDTVLSADTVQRLKPAEEPYRHAAQMLRVEVSQLWLVAAHGWDVRGAQVAGCRTALVARPGARLDPLGEPPDIVAADVGQVADRLLAATGA